ncbi:hypothetical protein ABIE52_006843 [Rhodococcus sp. OAS809]|uniref:hypothetical protein n=1 Tax=Rhodococcus sp. OAS809 TaxID=2663874 RepID=UPI00178AD22E
MTAQTATATAPAIESTGLSAWITEQRATIAEWNARGDRYNTFVAASPAETVTAFGAYMEDLTVHLDALADPAVTGLPSYSARDLLTELRHLRSLNDNVVRASGSGLVRRVAGSPRNKIRWGIAASEGSAWVYSEVTDRTAKSLAIALKSKA